MRPGKTAREERRERAKKRSETAVAKTPAQRLAELDRKLCKGIGAKRERARFAGKLERKGMTDV
jgi:threonine dehydratase